VTARDRLTRRIGLLLAGLLLLLLPAPARSQPVVETTLDNGLRVLLQPDRRTPLVSLQVWYRVGSRNERVGRTGLSHYLEHMMFKGTPRHGPHAYARLVEGQGGQENAFTTRDATAYYVNVAADRLDLILDLEADRMRNLLLDPREVDAERKVVMEERRTRTEDNPMGALAEAFNLAAFTAHPYRLPVIGFMQDLERLSRDDLRSWYDTYYVPNNAVLVAAGDFDAPELLVRIRDRFGAIARGADPPRVQVVEPPPRGERRVWVKKTAELPAIFVGYQTPNLASPDAYVLEVLSTLLSGGRASRLYRRLVYEQRLALDTGGEYSLVSVDPDPFTFYATALPGKTVEEVEGALMAEVQRLHAELVDEDELQRAKNQIEAGFLFGQDSVFSRAATLGRFELAGSWRLRDEYLPRVRAVTRADIQRVAREYFVRDRQTIAVLVPTPAR
jgi:zinc protease